MLTIKSSHMINRISIAHEVNANNAICMGLSFHGSWVTTNKSCFIFLSKQHQAAGLATTASINDSIHSLSSLYTVSKLFCFIKFLPIVLSLIELCPRTLFNNFKSKIFWTKFFHSRIKFICGWSVCSDTAFNMLLPTVRDIYGLANICHLIIYIGNLVDSTHSTCKSNATDQVCIRFFIIHFPDNFVNSFWIRQERLN